MTENFSLRFHLKFSNK